MTAAVTARQHYMYLCEVHEDKRRMNNSNKRDVTVYIVLLARVRYGNKPAANSESIKKNM